MLLGEPLEVLRRPLRSPSYRDNEVDQAFDLGYQQRHENAHHKDQRHHEPQVDEHYGQGAFDQSVASLEPVDRRVEGKRYQDAIAYLIKEAALLADEHTAFDVSDHTPTDMRPTSSPGGR